MGNRVAIPIMVISIVLAATASVMTWLLARASRIWTVYLFCGAMLVIFYRRVSVLVNVWYDPSTFIQQNETLAISLSVLMIGGCVGMFWWMRREEMLRNRLARRGEELSASERFLQSVVDALPVKVAVLDGDGVVLRANSHWSSASRNTSGLPASAAGTNFVEALESAGAGSPDGGAIARGLRDVLRGGRDSFFWEFTVGADTHDRAWHELRVRRFVAEDGKPRFLVIHEDKTSVEQAHLELDRSRQRLAAMIRVTPMAAILWDKKFCVLEWNSGAERVFGYTAEEAIGKQASFIIPLSARQHVEEIWAALTSNAGGSRSTNENLTRDGKLILCDWFNATLLDASGNVVGVSSLCDDITDRVKAEKDLRDSREEYRRVADSNRRLLSEVNHRVRNNIAGLLSLVEMTRRSAPSANEFAAAMTRRIRAMAQVQSLLVESQWRPVGLRALVNGVLDGLRSTAPYDVTLIAEGPAVSISARHSTPVAMTLAELFANSCKHGAHSVPSGRVEVTWTVHREGETDLVTLHWRETGGPRIEKSIVPSLGVELIEGFVRFELGGTANLRFPPIGVDHEFVFSAGGSDKNATDIAGAYEIKKDARPLSPASVE